MPVKYCHKYPEHNSPEYYVWQRLNTNHGDQIHADWKRKPRARWSQGHNSARYNNFLSFVGRRPAPGFSLSKINRTGRFEPGNVKWMTHSEKNLRRGPTKKYSYSTDEQLIEELERRGYDTGVLARRTA